MPETSIWSPTSLRKVFCPVVDAQGLFILPHCCSPACVRDDRRKPIQVSRLRPMADRRSARLFLLSSGHQLAADPEAEKVRLRSARFALRRVIATVPHHPRSPRAALRQTRSSEIALKLPPPLPLARTQSTQNPALSPNPEREPPCPALRGLQEPYPQPACWPLPIERAGLRDAAHLVAVSPPTTPSSAANAPDHRQRSAQSLCSQLISRFALHDVGSRSVVLLCVM